MNSYRIHTHYLVIIIAKKKRELSFVTRSLSLCVLVVVVVVCFHFSPTKVGVRYKNKNSLPSSLSLVLDESLRSSSAQMYMLQLCNQRTPRVLHKGRDLFFCHHRRALSLLRPYEREREREREREKERKRRARKNDADENFVSTKYAKRGKKTSRCYCFSAATREREIGSETPPRI